MFSYLDETGKSFILWLYSVLLSDTTLVDSVHSSNATK